MFRHPVQRALACSISLLALAALLVAVGGSTSASAASRPTLYHDGSRATFTVSGTGKIRITARAAYCKGFPVLRVWVDGKLDRTIQTTRRQSRVYSSAKTYQPGKHRVTVILRQDKKVTKKGKVVCNRRARIMAVAMAQRNPTFPAPHPGDADGAFTFAVIGDTQNEVLANRTTFGQRTAWIAANHEAQDIRFVGQTGDLVNWGWKALGQYAVADAALQKLTDAAVPWQAVPGNHDTAAVGWDGVIGSRRYGGARYDMNPECLETLGELGCKTSLLVRDTAAFNANIDGTDAGRFEGKLDNSYSTFSAAGRSWLVLNVELWPRKDAVEWAQGVVASHPRHNVIVLTHDYLNSSGQVVDTNGGYGANTATYLEKNLIAKYPNVKLVLSGHRDLAATRTFDYSGHRVVAYLGNEWNNVGVTRFIDVNVKTGVVASRWWQGTVNLSAAPSGTTIATGLSFE